MIENNHECPLCSTHIESYETEDHKSRYRYRCLKCGTVFMDEILEVNLSAGKYYRDILHIASGFTRERTWRRLKPVLYSEPEFEEYIRKIPSPNSMDEKIQKLMEFMSSSSESFGSEVEINPERDQFLTYSKTIVEFQFVLQNMVRLDLIENTEGYIYRITYNGWNVLGKRRTNEIQTGQVFIAMSFDSEMDSAYFDGIQRAVKDCGYHALRMKELEHNERIDDRIIAEIRKSDFVIADYTQQKKGVYFEAGYALGLNRPVIWCCRNDDLENCHFDTRQYNHVVWSTEAELYDKIKSRIESTIIR